MPLFANYTLELFFVDHLGIVRGGLYHHALELRVSHCDAHHLKYDSQLFNVDVFTSILVKRHERLVALLFFF